jgi:hypothetical protein
VKDDKKGENCPPFFRNLMLTVFVALASGLRATRRFRFIGGPSAPARSFLLLGFIHGCKTVSSATAAFAFI